MKFQISNSNTKQYNMIDYNIKKKVYIWSNGILVVVLFALVSGMVVCIFNMSRMCQCAFFDGE